MRLKHGKQTVFFLSMVTTISKGSYEIYCLFENFWRNFLSSF